ncbi:thiamine-phosphate pyrophosphorylase [Haloarcula hispanica N601]|uniref:Thiamine-phosphate synthase n=3 Tax=Haloarcula hispanica TaxID=51589 RepID=A0A482TCU0_HALHI|nr:MULTISPECIES: thiamine phosphate synthase [Haloarcula]AEM58211.1 thiamine-phosphate pyrophosphorylase [Haloarcula hispanica ATCC 33960]AHB66949.1 thiamine-phosphate pyrophosphorylase [Haloarcula hispanica N601]AJF25247.1 thiamine-phosphate synthase [Haloarcula sp. CBA1115]KAA9406133.1 thiamine phosphate synthase [Haloarcula sp. CBA1131]KAA9410839.1 thiamine phosphate synthase [Haloarcula hispanica]
MVDWDVYLVTQASLSAGRTTADIVADAIDGGVGVVQLREKDRTARERYELGRELRALTREAGVTFVVNDRVDIAQALDADGVHLGDDDLPVPVARELLGEDALIGRSVSTVADAEAAAAAGADYLGVGAVFATGSKDDIDDDEYAIGTDRVAAIADAVDIPFVGIGGITTENATEVVEAGADGVAVITEITQADDPAAAAEALKHAVERGQ